jgi:hypothetical protein
MASAATASAPFDCGAVAADCAHTASLPDKLPGEGAPDAAGCPEDDVERLSVRIRHRSRTTNGSSASPAGESKEPFAAAVPPGFGVPTDDVHEWETRPRELFHL